MVVDLSRFGGQYAVGFAIVITVLSVLHFALKKDRVSSIYATKNESIIGLPESELTATMYIPSVSSVSFYQGKVDILALRKRIAELISMNPWLHARLRKSNKHGKDTVAVYPTKFDPEMSNLSSIFRFVLDSSISQGLNYDALTKRLTKYLVKKGTECLNKDDESLFRVTLVEIRKDEEYALVVSMSHILGDGQTFYHVYSMLDMHTKPKALITERKVDFIPQLNAIHGQKAVNDWLHSAAFLIGSLKTRLFSAPPKASVFMLDHKEVERIKKQYIRDKNNTVTGAKEYGNVAFITTNDIFTSWFFKAVNSAFGAMVINCRGRLNGITGLHAGNYWSLLLYNASDFSKPSFIRESLPTMKSRSNTVPSFLESVDFQVSMVTNWSSFYVDVGISKDSVLSMHLPIYISTDVTYADQCVLFNMTKTQVGVLCLCRSVDMAVKHKEETKRAEKNKSNGGERGEGIDVSVLGKQVM